jgi:hypothetical protein
VVPQPFDKRCITPHRDGIHLFAIERPHVAWVASQSRAAFASMVFEHGCKSPGELDMTLHIRGRGLLL